MNTMKEIHYNEMDKQLYVDPIALFVESKGNAGPLALRMVIDPEQKYAAWNDTIRNRTLKFEQSILSDKKIILITADNQEWTFVALTVPLLNSAKSSLIPIEKKFTNDKEIQDFYKNYSSD